MKKKIIFSLLGILLVAIVVFFYIRFRTAAKVIDFTSCTQNGFPISGSYPRRCQTPDGRTYVEEVTPLPSSVLPSLVTPTNILPTENEEANIIVTEPKPHETVQRTFAVSGKARVFENVLHYQVTDDKGAVLAEGSTEAQSPDVGQYGPFAIRVILTETTAKTGKLEVFSLSPKDGSEINNVTIPLQFK